MAFFQWVITPTPQKGGHSHMDIANALAPSPARCARHLSPAKQGRGYAGRGLAPILAPMKWGRGVEPEGRDGEGEFKMQLPSPLWGWGEPVLHSRARRRIR